MEIHRAFWRKMEHPEMMLREFLVKLILAFENSSLFCSHFLFLRAHFIGTNPVNIIQHFHS